MLEQDFHPSDTGTHRNLTGPCASKEFLNSLFITPSRSTSTRLIIPALFKIPPRLNQKGDISKLETGDTTTLHPYLYKFEEFAQHVMSNGMEYLCIRFPVLLHQSPMM